MSRYLDKLQGWFDGVAELMERTDSPRQKAILRNYLTHASLELSGRSDEIFVPELTIEHPIYHIDGVGLTEHTTFDGEDSVKGFYVDLNKALVLLYDQQLAVADWGVASFLIVATVHDGQQLLDLGVDVDDAQGRYVVEYPCAMRWPYDERARMIGEDVYQIGETKVTKLSAEDDVTFGTRNELAARYSPKDRASVTV
jgi:hypothetical protein